MNLQTIQKRVEELSAELLTLSNDLAFIVGGDVARETSGTILPVVDRQSPWAEGMKTGDTVQCVYIPSGDTVRVRCFTLGGIYTVQHRLTGNVGDYFYGIRVVKDNEGEGHDAGGVVFVKVG